MKRHAEPHDRDTCPRCDELRRQEFDVPAPRPPDAPDATAVVRLRGLLPPDPDADRETLWGDPSR